MYDGLEGRLEAEYGLPAGIMRGIRTRGERSNADQVSEAGARSVYQFIPSTRQGMIRNYGVDPWAGPEQAARAAALHLRDDYRHFGNWNDAVSAYHGGRNRARWGRRTRAYQDRVGRF
jgi:soluble lytic murein transglycosylase-like protein